MTCLILVITSYTDVKKRLINSYIFIPVVGVGAYLHLAQASPDYFVILGILIFLSTFLQTDLVIYPVAGMIFIAVSMYLTLTGNVLYGFTLVMMSLVLLIGFQERLFGIGDIKAMAALFFAFTEFPFYTGITVTQFDLTRIMPLSVMMLFNIAIVSMLFIPYVIVLNKRSGERIGIRSVTSISYDERIYSRNEGKFNLRETSSGKRLVYKTPFMVPVSIGFIVTMVAGFWFIFL